MKRVLTLTMLLGFLLCACGQSVPTWQEQYDLGVRYLSEGSYEEAVIAFTAAIEIDPKQAAAYVGRGDTYAAIAGQTQKTTDELIALWESAIADYEQADGLGDTQARKKLQESNAILQKLQIELDAKSKLEGLYAFFEENDVEGAKALMRQDVYKELSASISEEFCFYGESTGTGLAAYPNNFYYYGQWEDGLRSGQGIWIRAVYEDDSDMESYIYEGAWLNDLPNGEGYIISNRYPDKIQLEPGHTTSVRTETKGTFANGLYHGTIYEIWNMNNGDTHRWMHITAVNGIYQIIEHVGDRMIVARDQEDSGTSLSDSGRVHAVQGLGIQT